jgi:hypothetical protein
VLAGAFPLVPPAPPGAPQPLPPPPPPPPPRGRYYQGLHDVGALLLLGAGAAGARGVLRRVLDSAWLPYAREGVPLALDALACAMALLAAADAPLHAHVKAGSAAPHWGLSWVLTWFAHDVRCAGAGLRLFDAFLSGHPLLPAYAAAALLLRQRAAVLSLDPRDAGAFHQRLEGLPAEGVTDAAEAGQLVRAAVALYAAHPPAALLAALSRRAPDAAASASLRSPSPSARGRPPRPGGERRVCVARRWAPGVPAH